MRFRSEEQRRAVMARLAYARGVKASLKARRFNLPSGQKHHITGLPSAFNAKEYRKTYHTHRARTKRRVDYYWVEGKQVAKVPLELQRERIQAVARYHIKQMKPYTGMTPQELRKDLYDRAFEAQKEYMRNYVPSRKGFKPGTAVRRAVRARIYQLQETQPV